MGRKLRRLYAPRVDGDSFITTHIPKRQSQAYLELVDNRPKCTEIAYERIREYLFEIGRNDMGLEWGWIAHAAKIAGLNYRTAWSIVHREQTAAGPIVVEQISRKLRCPVSVFYDAHIPKVARHAPRHELRAVAAE